MVRRKWIDKKSAQHFTLVHRPQNDPRIHDESAPAMVLNPTELPNVAKSKSKGLSDLASQIGSEVDDIRANEGEAANYGVYFDDSEYDYMQHLREIGSGGGEAVFVDAADLNTQKKGKHKQSLADALKEMDLRDNSEDLLDEDILPSKNLQKTTYQSQQNVPDAIAGFQPDMDPRLREALEALEDDAYVDDEGDDDLFKELAKDGREINEYEFEDTYEDGAFDDDDGWESDVTEKPVHESRAAAEAATEAAEAEDQVPDLVDVHAAAGGEEVDGDWMERFKQFKTDQGKPRAPAAPSMSELESIAKGSAADGFRRKKRKGALTTISGFSMTSSTLPRTEQERLLDARYEQFSKQYKEDLNDMKSATTGRSSVRSMTTGNIPPHINQMFDEFLENSHTVGKRGRVRLSKHQTGLQQLDEIRQGLGPARLPKQKN